MKKSSGGNRKKCRAWKITRNILLGIIGLWAVILIILQIVLTPGVLTNLANNFAAGMVDGNVTFGKVRASVFRHFPYLDVTFDSLSVTYPSDRFEAYGAGKDWYTSQGRGETCDTLMSFNRLSASINLSSLIAGQINVPRISLVKPRIFATAYNDSTANWNIFKFMSAGEEEADTASAGIPDMVIGKIRLTDRPRIIFSSMPDSTSLSLSLKRMVFFGRVVTRDISKSRLGLRVDTLFMTGRFPTDTVAMRMDNFVIRGKDHGINVKGKATAYMATGTYGRMKLPVEMDARISFPKDTIRKVSIERFDARLADIPISAKADIGFKGDSIYVNGGCYIDGCEITKPIGYFGKNIMKGLADFRTDAVITLAAKAEGWLDTKGHIPAVDAVLEIPVSTVSHKMLGDNKIGFKAVLKGNESGRMDLQLDSLLFIGRGIALAGSGEAADLLGEDPDLNVDSHFFLNLDTLSTLLKKMVGYNASGRLAAELKGGIKMSQLSPYTFADADLKGSIKSREMVLYSAEDSLDIYIDSLDVRLGTFGNLYTSSIKKGERMMAVAGYVDSLRFRYKDDFSVMGRKLKLMAQNSAEILDKTDSSAFYPFGGKFEAGFLFLRGADTSIVAVAKSDNTFTISPKEGSPDVPVLDLKSNTAGIFLKGPVNRLSVRNLEMSANAAMNSIERRRKARAFVDSLSRANPDVPVDSLFRRWRRSMPERKVPEWLSEDDFRKSDISLNLGDNIKKYFREWDMDGSIAFARTGIMSPYFPLRTRINDFKGTFNNNQIKIEKLGIRSGRSDISATGSLTGLRMAVLRNGFLKLDVDVKADSLDMNQLLSAYSAGRTFNVNEFAGKDISGMEDSEFEAMILADSTEVQDTQMLIVVPANIVAELKLDARNVKYSKLEMDRMTADLKVRERCIQFTNTSATTNMGNLFFEGFYATQTKKDLKTGFNLNFSKITAEKVIEMLPAIDSVMPLLKSFKGELNMEMAATADIDTTMSIQMPTINGVIRIGGEHLQMHNDESIKKIAKILKFKDRENTYIDKMTVEGLISDSRLEIFPFVLDIDRYILAMSGVQNLDSSFKYHISVIQSPLPFRLGIDLWGDFSDMKFRIGKAKYKSANVPVFTAAVDEVKLNLAESIRNIFQKGVDEAVRENRRQKQINDYKKNINYVQAVDEQMDTLTSEEQKTLDME